MPDEFQKPNANVISWQRHFPLLVLDPYCHYDLGLYLALNSLGLIIVHETGSKLPGREPSGPKK